MSAAADSEFTPEIALSASQFIEAARQLHEQLFEDSAMPVGHRTELARQISGRLFAAEANGILPDACRAFFRRLRTDAYHRGNADTAKCLLPFSRISVGYDRIEEAAGYSNRTGGGVLFKQSSLGHCFQ